MNYKFELNQSLGNRIESESGKKNFLTASESDWLILQRKENEAELQGFAKPSRLAERFKSEFGEESTNAEMQSAVKLLGRFEAVADQDGLTHLENRRGLFRKGTDYFRAVESGSGKERSISVVSLDIDYFKAYNEISHTFGDVALQIIGKILLECTRDSGFSARLGGEEIFILVEKQISEEKIAKKALEIKSKIQKVLNLFFQRLDALKGKPGSVVEFLENAILTESRNRHGFNLEAAGMAEYAMAKKAARRMRAFDFNDAIEPADFVLKLKKAIGEARGEKKEKLIEIKSGLRFEVGTITVGAIYVDFKNDSPVSDADLAEMANTIENEIGASYGAAQKFEGKTYKEIYKIINRIAKSSAKDKAKFWRDLILKSQQKRFGRIVDQANSVTEEQKKRSRNSFVIAKETMAGLDSSARGNAEFVLNEYNLAQRALDKMMDDAEQRAEKAGSALIRDEYAAIFVDIGERIEPSERANFEKTMKILRRLQADRYYDALTRTKNYEYLSKIILKELSEADKNEYDYAIVSMDIDNLKAINEIGGHKLGDVALMTASRVMQEELHNLPADCQEKIKKTGFAPSVIRATGGEEFILTLPGLNSAEARQVFDSLNKKMFEAIRKICHSGGYEKEIKKYIAKLDFQLENGQRVKRSAEEIDKFGSATAGVISLRESKDNIMENGKLHAGKMRQIADMIGERLKNNVDDKGNSGRGKIGGLNR